MSSFAGVSVIGGSTYCNTSAVGTGDTESGYHLLVVKNYSRTIKREVPGVVIKSEPFTVGGRRWYISYYPNGFDSRCSDFISFYLSLYRDDDHDGEVEVAVQAKFGFSFVDQVEKQKPKYIRAAETCSFAGQDIWGFRKFIKRDVLERSTHLKDDSFTIRCDIMVCNDLNTQDGTPCDIGQHFHNLLQNKVGFDVTFEVSGEMFAAHRCVLAARSTVFMAQLFGPMKEGTTSTVIHIKDMEAKVFASLLTSTVIHIKDMEAKVFASLLSFIYTDSFPEMEEDKSQVMEQGQEEEEEVEHAIWLQDLFVAADRYDLQQLKLLCEERLSKDIDVSSVASTLALAEQHYNHRLKEACFKFIQVQSPPCLKKVAATDGWDHIRTIYPSLTDEITIKIASADLN